MKIGDPWKAMIAAFDAYVRRTGNGMVPTDYPENPRLGRWVAMIRYRRKLGELEPSLVAELDRKGFVWSPSERLWDAMFRTLLDFRAKFGHCDVSAGWTEHPGVASWVSNQRHLCKRGSLSKDRIRRLDEIGFRWNVYGGKGGIPPEKKRVEMHPAPQAAKVPPPQIEERLYHIGADGYVQYGGVGEMPVKLRRYLARHSEWPPHIPLPTGRTRFMLGGSGGIKARRVEWTGRGPLPSDIIAHVNENGCLPPHV